MIAFSTAPTMRYNARTVLENTITERSPRARQRGFFASRFPSMGGVRLSVRLAAWLCTRFQHPAHPHCLKTMAVASKSHRGASAMATIARSARVRTSVPAQSPAEIIRDALRDAALSDRPNDAIDTLADALVRLAAIAEVRHV